MLAPFANPVYRRLFGAQIIALAGTGLATIALALLAYDLAGAEAGLVLGNAMAIKMVAYVFIAPFANSLVTALPRKTLLIILDLIRAGTVVLLPFVTHVWQIYVLIFLLQSCSALFTPLFQAIIPDILKDEDTYTQALSLTRIAYNLETLLSPALAGLLLLFTTYSSLYGGTALGFIGSAFLILLAVLPETTKTRQDSFRQRLTRGWQIFAHTPRLRGILALNMTISAAGAMVFINTIVLVQSELGLGETETATALAVFGLGAMATAFGLPALLRITTDRTAMLGFGLLALALLGFCLLPQSYFSLLCLWFAFGIAYTGMLTPIGRVLARSSHQTDRTAIFAAQFSLSHAAWLICYLVAGWVGARHGQSAAAFALLILAIAGLVFGARLWPAIDPQVRAHTHRNLPPDDPHLKNSDGVWTADGFRHSHDYVIDSRHRRWAS